MPRRRPTPDRFVLYQRAVQEPSSEVDFIDAEFRRLRRRAPSRLREDFCGTAAVCCEWVKRRRVNTAVGLDLDRATLDWGLAHNVARLRPGQRRRVTLLRRNVLEPGGAARVDAVYSGNFSWWVFTTRRDLLRYFRAVRRSLVRDGLFILDIYGGHDAGRPMRERERIGGKKRGFWYTWRQAAFDPITARKTCHIDFALDDGTRLPGAFTYDWRLWTIPETREALADAGFRRTTVYWEGDEPGGGGDGDFKPVEKGEALASFVAYLAAEV